MFRNESEQVEKRVLVKAKAKAIARARSADSSRSTTPLVVDASAQLPEEASGSRGRLDTRQLANFATSSSPVYGLVPSIEDRATGYFFANYVIGVYGPVRGYLDHLEHVYKSSLDENLLASIKAVGLASFSNLGNVPALMRQATHEYAKALYLTNEALRDPVAVKKDSTLLGVMILSIFETVTGNNQRSLSAWAQHINGAAALLKLRGCEQFSTAGGRRMFVQVTSSILISCIQRWLPLPSYIVEMREVMKRSETINTHEPAWLLHEAMIEFVNFRASLWDESLSDDEVILKKALEMDQHFISIFADAPPGWEYKTIYTDADPEHLFNGCYHIYFDSWVAQIWNGMRSIRILLNDTIRNILLKGFSSKPPRFVSPEYTLQFQLSTDTMYQLQAGILASVPQHIGYVRKSHPSSRPRSSSANAVLDLHNSPPISDALWSPCLDAPSICPENEPPQLPVLRASAGYFLLWPLFLAGSMGFSTEETQRWVIKALESVGRLMGIQHALVLANVLRTNCKIGIWREERLAASKSLSQPSTAISLPIRTPD
jgi:Fungal specific transcription factor domain